MPNFGTAQELLTLRSRAAFYAPDLVLLAFLSGNDVRNNSRRLEPDRRRPFFSLGADGAVVADMSFRDDPDFQETLARRDTLAEELLRAWRLPQLIRRVKGVLKARQRAAGDTDAEPGMDDAVYLDEPGQDWDEAWAITEALLAEMRADVARLGARFLVVTLSNGIQVHPQTEVTESFMREHGIDDVFRPELRVAAMGQRQGFEALALAPELQRIARRERVYLHGFAGGQPGKGHWNVDGHRYAGELIARHLCRPT